MLAVWPPSHAAGDCSPSRSIEPVRVRYVADGDTLVLNDNRKIRLIGINTPETASQGQAHQGLAIKARDKLRQLLFQQGNRAQLQYGEQKQDKHGRDLAHLWLPDGRNLSAELLRQGLGWALAIPPNIRLLDCYLDAEHSARAASRGLWRLAAYAAVSSTQLTLRDKGFKRVRGRVTRVNRGGGATWINLEGRFAIRIPDQDLKWFETPPNGSWIGRNVEVRGWLYRRKGELRMNLHHPASFQTPAT